MTQTKADLQKRIDELEAETGPGAGGCAAVELECASIPVEWVEVGGVRVGLDAGGSAVRIELPDCLYGWTAEGSGD